MAYANCHTQIVVEHRLVQMMLLLLLLLLRHSCWFLGHAPHLGFVLLDRTCKGHLLIGV
jgi:hypothetical protein